MTHRDETRRAGRLAALRDLSEYTIASDDPDIRGWDVVAADRRRIGRVAELIVDPSTLRVRYLDVELAAEYRGERDARHVLVPIEKARLDEQRDDVLVDRITSHEAMSLPDFEHQEVDREYESRVWQAFSAGSPAPDAGTAADDGRFFGGRRRGREHAPYFTKRTAERDVTPPLATEPSPEPRSRPPTGGPSSPLTDEDPPRSRR